MRGWGRNGLGTGARGSEMQELAEARARYLLDVEPAAEGANEADGPLSAARAADFCFDRALQHVRAFHEVERGRVEGEGRVLGDLVG